MDYIGHKSQLYGVEEHRLVGGKGDGMRLLEVKNGKGVEMTLSLDRCSDISRLIFKGVNLGYFSPVGYVAPAFYDKDGANFHKSFTAGFMTTCGLTTVGAPCYDGDEYLPLHGTISNTPADNVRWEEKDGKLVISAEIHDERMFSRKLVLYREIALSLTENSYTVKDRVVNDGDTDSPLMLLYHMNMGYPLLSEKAELDIPSLSVSARTEKAMKGIDKWMEMLPPQKQYEEECFFHTFGEKASATIKNADAGVGLTISFDTVNNLDCFTEWKMMGTRDYVLGLEPGNCLPSGRAAMREEGKLLTLHPGESREYTFKVTMFTV